MLKGTQPPLSLLEKVQIPHGSHSLSPKSPCTSGSASWKTGTWQPVPRAPTSQDRRREQPFKRERAVEGVTAKEFEEALLVF